MEEKSMKAVRNVGAADINDIKRDLTSLRDNVVGLAQDIRSGGGAVVRDSLGQARSNGEKKLHKLEDKIREKPGQSIAMAFLGGLALSLFMGGRH